MIHNAKKEGRKEAAGDMNLLSRCLSGKKAHYSANIMLLPPPRKSFSRDGAGSIIARTEQIE
jgi:hypothetical protein